MESRAQRPMLPNLLLSTPLARWLESLMVATKAAALLTAPNGSSFSTCLRKRLQIHEYLHFLDGQTAHMEVRSFDMLDISTLIDLII